MKAKTYDGILKNLKEIINTKRNKKTPENFKNCLRELKDNFNFELSTKFLRNLVNTDDRRKKTFRIAYLIRRAGLTTRRQNRYFDRWANQIRNIEVTEYQHTDGFIYDDFPRHLFNEEMKIKGENENRLNLRNAINLNGGVKIKKISVARDVNIFFKTHDGKEVLFFIKLD